MTPTILCNKCKTEPAIIHLEGQGDYCLKCHNEMMLKHFGMDDTYNYAENMSVVEPDGEIHTFKISHIILGGIVSWEAEEQDGDYHFKIISSLDQNGAEVAKSFFKKIVDGVLTKTLHEHDQPFSNVLYKDGRYYSVKDKGIISIVEDDDTSEVCFVIDGHRFTATEFSKLFGPHVGFNIQYRIQDEADSLK